MSAKRLLLSLLVLAGLSGSAGADTAGLGLRPMRLEMDATPGEDRTMSFLIESPPADSPIRGRLLLTLGDWSLAEDRTVSYHEPGSQPNSAAPWLVLSSSDLTISSGQERLIRVTARVPAGTTPGVYSSAVFVQERPPASLPNPGDHRFYFRFRYVVTVYVIVSPVSSQGTLEDARVATGPDGMHRLVARLANTGTRHARPTINWFVRQADATLIAATNVEATVLLPASAAVEVLDLGSLLPPGSYDIEIQVDFHDGRPLQAIDRSVVVHPMP